MTGPPPLTTEAWPALRGRNARRARRLVRRLPDGAAWHAAVLAALGEVVSSRSAARDALLEGHGFRAWLAAAEEALQLLHPPLDDGTLFERVAAGPHLARLVPRGRLDASFRTRVGRLARDLRDRLMLRLIPLLMFRAAPAAWDIALPLARDADGEEARAEGEIHIEWPRPATATVPRGARVRLGEDEVRFTKGGAPLWRPRPSIPGSSIVLARRVVSTRAGLKPAGRMPGRLAALGSALSLLRRAWPEAHAEVEAHTRVVVPLRERNTVSFSMPSRPGVSYINLEGKSLVDVADDLLHETAHHRLHLLEEAGPLVRGDGDVLYHSPWRRAPRPVRGLLHATYTFSYRAELLSRLLHRPKGGSLPRAWIARELEFERLALARALDDLADASRRGLLTRRGEAVRAALRSPFG